MEKLKASTYSQTHMVWNGIRLSALKGKEHFTYGKLRWARSFYRKRLAPGLASCYSARLWTSYLISVNPDFLTFKIGILPPSNSTYSAYSNRVEISNHFKAASNTIKKKKRWAKVQVNNSKNDLTELL